MLRVLPESPASGQWQISFLGRPLLSDPTGDMDLETAVNGRADLLVTFNQVDFAAAAKTFAVKIVRPSEALRRLRHRHEQKDGERL